MLVFIQLVVAFGLLNVWLLRRDRASEFRGRGAGDLRSEFEAYGLPRWAMWAVGTAKVGAALLLIAGLWVPELVRPAAALLVVLMAGAVAMHFKVGDPVKRCGPAAVMLVLVSLLATLGGGSSESLAAPDPSLVLNLFLQLPAEIGVGVGGAGLE